MHVQTPHRSTWGKCHLQAPVCSCKSAGKPLSSPLRGITIMPGGWVIQNQAALWAPHLKQLGPICVLKQTDFGYLRRCKLGLKCLPWLKHLWGLSPLWNLLWFVWAPTPRFQWRNQQGLSTLWPTFQAWRKTEAVSSLPYFWKKVKDWKLLGSDREMISSPCLLGIQSKTEAWIVVVLSFLYFSVQNFSSWDFSLRQVYFSRSLNTLSKGRKTLICSNETSSLIIFKFLFTQTVKASSR